MSSDGEPDLSTLRFLVVEDHGFQRWALAHMLEEMGAANVASAGDAQLALGLLRSPESPPDIVVTDLNMPGMDGMEFIRHVGESGVPVSIVLASGLDRALIASVEGMTSAYGLHLLGAIEKPVTARKLAAVLRNYKPRATSPLSRRPSYSLEEIESAVARDEFVPHFQAKVDLDADALRGAEALVRWRHRSRGLVPPSSFVVAIEATPALERLTDSMMRQAATACREWRLAHIDATVSVNLSPRSLSDTSLAERLRELVSEAGLEPRDVTFEVTESAAATHVGRSLENLSRLRMLGFGLAIDDYGTGYSSMSQLTRIPFTELKIDQSFVRAAPRHVASRAVVESSLEMAAKLGIAAVAEGVETAEQVALLRSLGCSLVQGYFIAQPMPQAEFLDWAREFPRRTRDRTGS